MQFENYPLMGQNVSGMAIVQRVLCLSAADAVAALHLGTSAGAGRSAMFDFINRECSALRPQQSPCRALHIGRPDTLGPSLKR